MSQGETVGDLGASVGYALKQASTALRSAMDQALRPLQVTVSQYSCLEVLAQRPGASNADLARATFVSPQAMHGVLRGLEDRGLLSRPTSAAHGRALPTELTPAGRRLLHAASAEVRAVEDHMLAPLDAEDRQRLLTQLAACTGALAPTRNS